MNDLDRLHASGRTAGVRVEPSPSAQVGCAGLLGRVELLHAAAHEEKRQHNDDRYRPGEGRHPEPNSR
jgi:hypothetical protein